jgi:hypothetical protein
MSSPMVETQARKHTKRMTAEFIEHVFFPAAGWGRRGGANNLSGLNIVIVMFVFNKTIIIGYKTMSLKCYDMSA